MTEKYPTPHYWGERELARRLAHETERFVTGDGAPVVLEGSKGEQYRNARKLIREGVEFFLLDEVVESAHQKERRKEAEKKAALVIASADKYAEAMASRISPPPVEKKLVQVPMPERVTEGVAFRVYERYGQVERPEALILHRGDADINPSYFSGKDYAVLAPNGSIVGVDSRFAVEVMVDEINRDLKERFERGEE